MLLLAYDGSPDSQAAIAVAGKLMGGQPATVVSVWEPFTVLMARAGPGAALGAAGEDSAGIDAANERAARDTAEEGAERARRAGLKAEPRVLERGPSVAQTILDAARAGDATAIILGSRGLTGLKSMLLGSVSHEVLHNADRATLVVPSPAAAAERAGKRP